MTPQGFAMPSHRDAILGMSGFGHFLPFSTFSKTEPIRTIFDYRRGGTSALMTLDTAAVPLSQHLITTFTQRSN